MLGKGTVPDVQKKREEWQSELKETDIEHLIFLDESGVNTDMTRIYGRSKGGSRVIDSVPMNTPTITTVLSSIRIDGEKVYTSYQGGTTKERFLEYLKKLIPSLRPGDIVVMDNMKSHHAKVVTSFLDENHIEYRYLPPYSPDMNPIEKMWSKMKAYLRKQRVRLAEQLPDAIGHALASISAADCQHWFSLVF